jgi:hypothetical protein
MKFIYRPLALIAMFFLFCVKDAQAQILHVDNFEGLRQALISEAAEDTLVLFDVDDVLITSTAEFDFRPKIRKTLKKKLGKKYTKQETQYIFADFFRKRKVKLVNKDMPALLEELKKKKVAMTALSAWWTGKFGPIDQMENLRFKGLDEVGISFVSSSPFDKDIAFHSHKTVRGGTPMIVSGIILAAFVDKGDILELALNHTQSKFNRVIFVDDNREYINGVEEACNRLGLQFLGLHYTEAAKLPLPTLDEDLERYRFKVLEEEGVWLLDEELNQPSKPHPNKKKQA